MTDHDVVPPGYKRTEVGVIPEGWEVKRLGDVLERIVGGGTPSRTNRKFWGGHIPWATVKDFGTYNPYRTQETITKEGLDNSASNLIRAGTLITSTRMLLGKCVIYQVDVCINQDLKALFCNNSIDVQYLLYWFQYHEQLIDEMGSGSTVKGLSTNDLKSLCFISPPISEQHAIAAALSDVDGLIGALDALISKKRDMKQAAMQQLLTGRTRLPGFEGEWEEKRLGEVASIRNQKVLPSNVDQDTLCLELEHIGQGDGRLLGFGIASDSTSTKYLFFNGDVLFGRLRSYLRKFWHADRAGICTTEIWPLMVDGSRINSGFLYAAVQSDRFVEAASISYGTHMPRADWGVMKNFEIYLPSLPEQTAIATVLSDMDAEIAALECRRDKAKEIKQGMMQQLLTGKVRLVSREEMGEHNNMVQA